MALRFPARILLILGIVILAIAAAVGGWLAWQHQGDNPSAAKPFRECATEAGLTWEMHFLPNEQGQTFKINLYDHGNGLAVGDFDGDGLDDIYFCNQLGPNALYRNKGDGTFEEVAAKAGVALGDRICVGAVFVDYDNDGHPDLFVTSTRGGNVLFRNRGDGTFEDVTEKAGLKLKDVGHSQSAVFFDYDNDGYLDLFVTNTARWTTDNFDRESKYWLGIGDQFGGIALCRKETNKLYHNNRDGTFTDVTEKAGLKGLGWGADVLAFDYNGDGKLDLFVTSMFGRCQLYRNNGDGTFTDVTLEVLGRTPWGSCGAGLFDFNNDGRLDLCVVDMHSDMWMGPDFEHESFQNARKYEKIRFPNRYGPLAAGDAPEFLEREKEQAREIGYRVEEVVFGNALYRNNGGGKFTDIADKAGVETFWPWGVAIGDYRNQGYEDFFISSGMGYPFYFWPNYLMMNQGDETFINQATELGIEPTPRGKALPKNINRRMAVRSSRCAVAADFRGVGQLDIVTNNFNDQPYYFKNQLPRKNYIAFRLAQYQEQPRCRWCRGPAVPGQQDHDPPGAGGGRVQYRDVPHAALRPGRSAHHRSHRDHLAQGVGADAGPGHCQSQPTQRHRRAGPDL